MMAPGILNNVHFTKFLEALEGGASEGLPASNRNILSFTYQATSLTRVLFWSVEEPVVSNRDTHTHQKKQRKKTRP